MTDKPRRHRGEGAVYERKPGQWCGQIDLGYVDGKRRRRTIYGPTQEAVVREIRKLHRQLDDAGDLPTSDTTVEKWLRYWLTHIAVKRLKPKTYSSYKTCVEQHIIPAIGKRRLSKLSTEHIDQMHGYVMDTRGLSSTTAMNAHRVLSIALNDAVRRNRAGRNIAALVDAPPKAASTRTGLTAADAVKVLKVAGADERLGSRWLAAFTIGARQGEVLGLRWEHVDLDAGTVDIAWSLQRVPYQHGCAPITTDPTCGRKRAASCPQRQLSIRRGLEFRQIKGNLCLLRPKTIGSMRVVAMVEPMWLALLRRHEQVETERLSYTVDHDLVWCTKDGGPIDPRDDWVAWTELLKAAGVRHVTGHETRHTTATLLLEGKVDPAIIKDILGHSSILTTQGYQHVAVALQRQALEAGVTKALELS